MSTASLLRLLALSAIWGASFLFTRIAAPVLGGVMTSFGRVVLGALGLGLVVALTRLRLDFGGKRAAVLALGVINSGLPFLLFAYAAQRLPVGHSAMLNAMTPLMGVVVGGLFFGEPVTWRRVAGLLIGLLGIVVLVGGGSSESTAVSAPAAWLGVAACLLATLCYAVAGFLTRRWIGAGGLDSRLVAFGSQVGATLVLAPFAALHALRGPLDPAAFTPPVLISMLGLGLLCTAFAYILYFQLIADVGALKALTVTFLIPPFGLLWGWLVLGEPITLAHLGGGALIALALALVLGKR